MHLLIISSSHGDHIYTCVVDSHEDFKKVTGRAGDMFPGSTFKISPVRTFDQAMDFFSPNKKG